MELRSEQILAYAEESKYCRRFPFYFSFCNFETIISINFSIFDQKTKLPDASFSRTLLYQHIEVLGVETESASIIKIKIAFQ